MPRRLPLGRASLASRLVAGRYNPALDVVPQVGCSSSALFITQCQWIVSFILYAADLVFLWVVGSSVGVSIHR